MRNRIEDRNNLMRAFRAEWWRRKQKIEIRPEALVNIEPGIALPTASEVKFPSHAGNSRSHEAVIHLSTHRPRGRVQSLPAGFELLELLVVVCHGSRRPIWNQAGRALKA